MSLGAAATEVAAAGIASGVRVWHCLLVVLSAALGIASFLRPGDTFTAVAALMSFFLIFRGVADLFLGS